jgi:hypothetical protein
VNLPLFKRKLENLKALFQKRSLRDYEVDFGNVFGFITQVNEN